MKIYKEAARELPVVYNKDVLVVGGGPAGVCAALAAARSGSKVLLVETQFCLGGMATAGMVNRLGPYHDCEKFILGGIPMEVLQTLVDRGLAQKPQVISVEEGGLDPYWVAFDPEGMKILLDELLEDAGVKVLLMTNFCMPIIKNDCIKGVICENKSGRFAIMADVVIDASGDGDVAARSGVPFEIGRAEDRGMQPVSMFFKCLNMDCEQSRKYYMENYHDLRAKAEEECGNSFVHPGIDNLLRCGETYFNSFHVYGVDSTNAEEMSAAASECRKLMWRNTDFIRRHIPGCQNVSISTSAMTMGIRESRRINGEYTLTMDDVLQARQFDDQVYRYACYVDIHPVKDKVEDKNHQRGLQKGESYGIPYRCLVPKKIDGLLVAGRCLSSTHEGLASGRMMPSCMAMGQAVGTAAAIATQNKTTPRELDPKIIRVALKSQDVIL